MLYSNIPLAQMVVLQCKNYGISRIVISPGSRNAPLTLSFLADPFFKCFSIVDERAAAFFGLGMAQQTREAVVLVCTSGSALLNYYPAISEAFYSQIPLVVLSADRPTYLIDKGYGQTIRQVGVFQNHIDYTATLKQDASHAKSVYESTMPQGDKQSQAQIEEYNLSELHLAFKTLLASSRPVHINTPFEEPLYGISAVISNTYTPDISKQNDSFEIAKAAKLWNSAHKIMILIGVCHPQGADILTDKLWALLAADPRVLILTETTSNMSHPDCIDSIDNLMAPMESHHNSENLFKALQPDLLISFGGAVVSKKVKSFLAKYKPLNHMQLGNELVVNPFFTHFISYSQTASVFFNSLLANSKIDYSLNYSYKSEHLVYKKLYKKHIEKYSKQAPFSDFKAFYLLLKKLPKSSLLQLANSATIRYAQLFSIDPSIRVFCNRGTSGIDGSTATAIGASVTSERQTVLITGDLSFFYDSNGLWNQYIPKNFRIILINNQGGGIFRVLPGKSDSNAFETYFETVHTLESSHLCALHKIAHTLVDEVHSLESELVNFFSEGSGPRLLEIKTPRTINDLVLKNFFKQLQLSY